MLNVKINLLALSSAFIATIKGKDAAKRCVCIPIEENEIFEGENSAYLSLLALESAKLRYGKTHLLKRNISKEVYQAMDEQQKREIPIIGDMGPIGKSTVQTTPDTAPEISFDDLPF